MIFMFRFHKFLFPISSPTPTWVSFNETNSFKTGGLILRRNVEKKYVNVSKTKQKEFNCFTIGNKQLITHLFYTKWINNIHHFSAGFFGHWFVRPYKTNKTFPFARANEKCYVNIYWCKTQYMEKSVWLLIVVPTSTLVLQIYQKNVSFSYE